MIGCLSRQLRRKIVLVPLGSGALSAQPLEPPAEPTPYVQELDASENKDIVR
jgi:hypothetical protein